LRQQKFNKEHNITPVGISKSVKDIIETLEDEEEFKKQKARSKDNRKYEDLTEPEIIKEIGRLEKSMQVAARNLEFESAAEIRDKVNFLKEKIYGASIKDKI
jgi:excinuclease ABC subunit B